MRCRIRGIHFAVLSKKKWVYPGTRQVMDGPSRTVNPACTRLRRAQARKGLGENVQFGSSSTTRLLPENLGTHCRELPAEKARAEVLMLIQANSKPRDIVIYTDGSVTRNRSGWGFTVKEGGRIVHEDWRLQSHDPQSYHGCKSSHTCNTVTSLPNWPKGRTDYTCHHSHRLNELPANGGVWNGLP